MHVSDLSPGLLQLPIRNLTTRVLLNAKSGPERLGARWDGELRDVACKTGRHIQMQSFGSEAAVSAFLEADQDGKAHVGNKRVRGEREGVKNANERRPFADQGPELVADKRSLQAPSCCIVRSCSKSPIVM